MSPELCDAVRGLLKFESLNRLGCLTDGAADVKRHPFFAAEDWDALLAQSTPPPFVPKLTSNTDTSNFEEAFVDRSFVDEPAYDYSKDFKRMASMKDFPYKAVDGTCDMSKVSNAMTKAEVTGVTWYKGSDAALAKGVVDGVVTVAIRVVKDFNYYRTGLFIKFKI